ncbi:unnamed protein product, partial [Closterium sp. NIES-53]
PIRYDAGHMVHELPTAVFNWAHRPSRNFFHFLVELVPLFLAAAPLMPSTLRHLPVLARHCQVRMYEQMGAPLIGIPPDQIRLLPTFKNDLFHANVVYQPIYQECHYPSRPLWKLLRRQHLLHPTGLPLFNPDWTHRSHPPLSSQEARSFPSDWVVVLAKRAKGKRRSMENGDEVEEEVVRRFGHERVVTYNGSLPILQAALTARTEPLSSITPVLFPFHQPPFHPLHHPPSARALFMRARLFIAAHGAALTNMIFMPEKASLLEIRPQKCPTRVFNGLAAACSLQYHLVFSQGTCSSTVVVNVTSVARVLDAMQARFQTEDGGGEGMGAN